MSERYTKLFSLPANLYAASSPVIVSAGNLLKDNQTGKVLVQLKLRNLSKVLKAITVIIYPKDAAGKPLGEETQYQYLDLTVCAGAEFGQKTAVYLPNASTRSFSVKVKQAVFLDNSIWESDVGDWEPLPKVENLFEKHADAELVKQYRIEFGESCDYYPLIYKDLWLCSCGTWNQTQETCYSCGQIKEKILSFDEKALIENKNKRLAQEKEEREAREAAEREAARVKAEKKAQKAHKAKRVLKKSCLLVLALAILSFLIYAIGWHIIPYVRYQNASRALESQSFDKAYDTFAALGTFRDSADKAIDALYQKGVYLRNSGLYLEAAAEFDRVADYQDSKEQAVYCRNEAAYLDAKALFESKSYKEAAEVFMSISEYSDSADQAIVSNYLYGQELFENGEYENAHAVLSSIAGYNDSKELADESYYRLAAQLFAEQKYDKAYSYFIVLSSYKDSIDLANESKYLYGIERFDAGDYEKAVAAFKLVKDYKDVGERLPEAMYQFALALTEEKAWKAASSLFNELGNYQDSAKKYKETYYQYGLQLLSSESYKEAVTVFEALGSYQESKAKLNEAKYGYVLAHKNNSDSSTYSYLKDLKAVRYKDAKDIYNSLYAWSVELLCFNTNREDYTTISSSVSRWTNYLRYGFQLQGGPPGESVTLTHRTYWPDGSVRYSNWNWENKTRFERCYCFWDDGIFYDPSNAARGTMTVKIYIRSTGECIGSFSIRIT